MRPGREVTSEPLKIPYADPFYVAREVLREAMEQQEAVVHPSHYGGGDNPYETIKVIRAWGLGFDLGNAVKYISRAGKKDPAKTVEDLRKAIFYIEDEIKHLEG